MAKTKAKTKSSGSSSKLLGGLLLVLILLCGLYAFYWFQIAALAKTAYVDEISKLANGAEITEPNISGFPGKMILSKDIERLNSDQGTLEINNLTAKSWPIPKALITIDTGQIKLRSNLWLDGLSFDSFSAVLLANADSVEFKDSALKQNDFEARVTGSVDISDPGVAIPDLLVTLDNHQDFLQVLVASGIIEQKAAAFVGFGLQALTSKESGKIEVPIYARNSMIHLGPLPILQLPQKQTKTPAQSLAPKRVKPNVSE